jgi:hypothetical protein
MKLSGKVEHVDVGTGAFVLVGDDGKRYQLAGGDRGMKKAGQRIEVDGDVDADAVSSAMVGPLLRVKSYRAI